MAWSFATTRPKKRPSRMPTSQIGQNQPKRAYRVFYFRPKDKFCFGRIVILSAASKDKIPARSSKTSFSAKERGSQVIGIYATQVDDISSTHGALEAFGDIGRACRGRTPPAAGTGNPTGRTLIFTDAKIYRTKSAPVSCPSCLKLSVPAKEGFTAEDAKGRRGRGGQSPSDIFSAFRPLRLYVFYLRPSRPETQLDPPSNCDDGIHTVHVV